MTKTIEDIQAELKAIVDGAENRSLTDDEVKKYEGLEAELAKVQKDNEIRSRQKAYEAPVNTFIPGTTTTKDDDGLERAFEAYMRTGQKNQDITQLRAQETGSDSEGGYLVPDGFRQKLVEVKKAFGGFAAEAEHITTSTGASLEYPSLDDTANAGGITAEEAAVASGNDLTFGTVQLGSFKYTSAGAGSNLPLRVSWELAQDSAFDIQGLVARALGTRIARKQAVDWTTGTGTTLPFGIVRSNDSAHDHQLAAHDTVTYADLSALEAKLDPAYEANAKWVMNKKTWVAVRDLFDGEDGAGRPLVWDSSQALRTRAEKSILGYPVVIDQTMPDYDDTSAHFIALGDWKEAYVIRHVSDFVLVVDPYGRAVNGQIQYLAWERADGNIQNRKAYVFGQNSAS